MTLCQEIILYFIMIPLASLYIISLIDEFVEEYKNSQKIIRKCKKENRKINEQYEKEKFFRSLGWR